MGVGAGFPALGRSDGAGKLHDYVVAFRAISLSMNFSLSRHELWKDEWNGDRQEYNCDRR